MNRQKKKTRIGIIGGGSVAVSYVRQLIDKLHERAVAKPVEILIFEPRETIGAGAAYEDDVSTNLLNTRADSMSAIQDDKEHFLRWLSENEAHWRADFPGVTVAPGAFLPRPLFGRYLDDVYKGACRMARRLGVVLRHIREEAVDIRPELDGLTIRMLARPDYKVDYGVLCVGNLKGTKWREFEDNDHYFGSPYPCKKLVTEIDRQAAVGIIGTSLSAIDAVIALSEGGHTGKLICASRNGRLPSVRGDFNQKHTLKYLTPERIRQIASYGSGNISLSTIMELLVREVEEASSYPISVDGILNEQASVYRYLETEIEEANNGHRPWQAAIYALNDVIDMIWNALPLAEKKEFFASWRSKWMSYRVSFPVENAIRLATLMQRDAFSVVGGLTEVSVGENGSGFTLRATDKRWGNDASYKVDYVIDATGYSLDVSDCSSEIMRNLLKRKLAIPNPLAGINVDYESGNLITSDGSREERIYVQGSLATGTYFWTNAMDVNVRIAARQAEHLVGSLKRRELAADGMSHREDLVYQEPALANAVGGY